MKAVTWHGKRDVRVETVPDPKIQEPTDAIMRITIDQHLRVGPAPVRGAGRRSWTQGDILGHEPMGIVEEVGAEVDEPQGRRPGRHAVPDLLRALLHVRPAAVHPVRDDPGPRPGHGRGAVRLLQAVRRGARRAGRVPARAAGAVHPHQGARRARRTTRFVYLSDVLPTAWQAVAVRRRPEGRHASPCSASARSATWRAASPQHQGDAASSASTWCPSGSSGLAAAGVEVIDLNEHDDDLGDVIRDLTDGRGTDSVIDAVGMEAHGSPVAKVAQQVTGLLPDAIAEPLMQNAGVDRLAALLLRDRHRPPRRHHLAHRRVRRHGRPDADADAVRQADPAADGPGQRQALGRRHHAAADRRRPAGRRRLRHPHGCRSTRRRTPTRCSRRSRTAQSRSS